MGLALVFTAEFRCVRTAASQDAKVDSWVMGTFNRILIKATQEVRKAIIRKFGSIDCRCLDASTMLRKKLIKQNYPAKIIEGKFKLDIPVPGPHDKPLLTPLHYWVELNNKIIDVTADQFQNAVRENLKDVVYGTYQDHPRYKITSILI
jgi:hypothetical protein